MERGSRLLAVLLLAWLGVMAWAVGARAAIELQIDGRTVTTEPALALLGLGLGVAQPVLQHELGVLVDDSTFPVVTLVYGNRMATIVVDDRRAVVDGRRVELQAAPEVHAGVLYVPLHLVADMVGLRVEWDVLSGTLRLEHRTQPAAPALAFVPAGGHPAAPLAAEAPGTPPQAAPMADGLAAAQREPGLAPATPAEPEARPEDTPRPTEVESPLWPGREAEPEPGPEPEPAPSGWLQAGAAEENLPGGEGLAGEERAERLLGQEAAELLGGEAVEGLLGHEAVGELLDEGVAVLGEEAVQALFGEEDLAPAVAAGEDSFPNLAGWLELLAEMLDAEPAPPPIVEAPAVLHQVDLFVDNGRVVLEVAADKAVAPRAMYLPNPARLVVDVPNAVLATGWRTLPGDGKIVTQLRASATPDGGVRLVADLTAPTGYRLQADADGRRFVVQLNQQIRSVSAEPTAVGGLSLWLETTGPLRYSAFVLRQPARVVIDLAGATVEGPWEAAVDSPFASSVRVSQYAPDVVRVVVELRGTTTAALFTSRLAAAVEGEAQPGADGRVALVLHPLTGVVVERSREAALPLGNVVNVAVLYAGETEFVLIEADTPLQPVLRRLREPERLVVDLPGTQVARSLGLTGGGLSGGVVATVRAGQAEPTMSRIVVELNQIAEHHLMVSPDGRRAVLALRRSHLAGRTIVVDPGHGGRDPGAIGYSGTYEKDVTLAIGLLVAGMLEKAGATVVMTRHEDATVELSARTALANAVGADAFVSIHADAVGFGRIASGTSTFFYPENGDAARSVNRRYAEAIHTEVLGQLGLNDRGVHQRALYVVRNTVMPAALVEVGFIDNPSEEKLLLDPDFQARAAAGIVQGIVRFFAEEQQLDVPPARREWQLAAEQAVSGFLAAGELPAEALALEPMALVSAVPEPLQDGGF
ncbi:MAG: N-acetylmuramoyl-L-alanine amidase family protein [Limnochordales bacterium]